MTDTTDSGGDLFFVHSGYSWYIPYAIETAIRNSGMRVHFVGDRFACQVAKALGARTYLAGEYSRRATEFGKIYRHHSSLGVSFERICIERWFTLHEVAAAHGFERFVYADTDILVVDNLPPYVQKTASFGLMFDGVSAHLCFVNRREALRQLCDFVEEVYRDREWEPRMEAVFAGKMAEYGGGGVSDMTMFQWFREKHPDVLGTYDEVFGVNPFDGSLFEFVGFEADEKGFKKLGWNGRTPSATMSDGQSVTLATLHHQGHAKTLLKDNARRLGSVTAFQRMSAELLDFTYRASRRLRLVK
ncbi:hypothetical protein Pan44_38910 [Caulifigura coniformis]|uniref:Nucleotide-diphospho-sugar transferase n=1 Tax=Caulifigura coniformis TaxID=2527983 RepID=A0A517SI90_9PLAN|nr:hypothetical protein [Caulifigura coniformis]QDT55843.1 hypothetical protein Pan44_38910 [Caulifigura coniformis]